MKRSYSAVVCYCCKSIRKVTSIPHAGHYLFQDHFGVWIYTYFHFGWWNVAILCLTSSINLTGLKVVWKGHNRDLCFKCILFGYKKPNYFHGQFLIVFQSKYILALRCLYVLCVDLYLQKRTAQKTRFMFLSSCWF